MSVLLQLKAFAELEEQLKQVTPEDVAVVHWVGDLPEGVRIVGEASFLLKALSFLQDRADMEWAAVDELHKAATSHDDLITFLNEATRLFEKKEALTAMFVWAFQAEFPCPKRTLSIRVSDIGLGKKGEAYYVLERVSVNGEDREPLTNRHVLH